MKLADIKSCYDNVKEKLSKTPFLRFKICFIVFGMEQVLS